MKIAMYGGALRHWGLLYPNALNEDVPSPGGTELAMMNIARALAKRGHAVTVFADCEPGTYEGVDYIKADAAIFLMSQVHYDVVVSWQDAIIFLHPLKTRLRVLMSQSAHLGLGQAAPYVDRYFGVSRYSAQLLLENEPYADPAKMWITRNGVDVQRFVDAEARAKATAGQGESRNRHNLVWASSPDRGLHHLLPIFRRVKELVPDATLTVAYEFDKTYESYKQTQPGSTFMRFLDQAAELRKEPGVTFVNQMTQPKLADLMTRSGILVYPADPVRPTETYCNVITEALAAGMTAFVSAVDCLEENYAHWANLYGLPVDYDQWATDLAVAMNDGPLTAPKHRAEEVRRICDYDEVAIEWEAFFTDFLNGREGTADRSLTAHRLGECGISDA